MPAAKNASEVGNGGRKSSNKSSFRDIDLGRPVPERTPICQMKSIRSGRVRASYWSYRVRQFHFGLPPLFPSALPKPRRTATTLYERTTPTS